MPVVILDHAHWVQLEQVQRAVNDKVRYEDDQQDYGVAEFWEVANKRGDCEDYALAKRQRLMELGWPADSLRIATAFNERGELHAVLTVDVTAADGRRGTYVLDNRFADVEPWQLLVGYRWLERQGPTEYAWTYIGNPMTLQIAAAAITMKVAMGADPTVAAAVATGVAAAAAQAKTPSSTPAMAVDRPLAPAPAITVSLALPPTAAATAAPAIKD